MPETEERRKESRFTCNCAAHYAVFARSVFHRSRIADFSEAGMRIRTRTPAEIGSTLLIQVTGPVADGRADVDFRCPLNRTIGVGQVMWCEKSGRGEAEGYDLGLKIQVS